jgi:redox-sensitive bicupin YhaK (pirin superfamily)
MERTIAADKDGAAKVDIRRASERFVTRASWLISYHSFSFANHYDPDNLRFGLLVVNNDDTVQPNGGFRSHPHMDMEIVTWVLEGALEHRDSTGGAGVIYPGLAQRMSAGTGIWHSEMNPSSEHPVHFVQMWVIPDTTSVRPGYEQLDIRGELKRGQLVPLAGGRGRGAAVSIHQRDALLWVGKLAPGTSVAIPEAPLVHLYVAKGSAKLEGAGMLATADAARLCDAGARQLNASPRDGAEVLIWEMRT